MGRRWKSQWLGALLLAGALGGIQAAEVPIGKAQVIAGMEVGAVYLQPIAMEPAGMMREARLSDIHLEADIRAAKGNANGFAEGDWVPHLVVRYRLAKAGEAQVLEGELMPMVASDGPHYGDNVKLDGPGQYQLTYRVAPPGGHHPHAFGRHTDKETGVGPWFKPFVLEYEFVYAGVGKKGGY